MNEIKELFDSISSFEDVRKLFPITKTCVYLDSAHYSQYSLETNRRLFKFINEFTHTNLNLGIFNNEKSKALKEKIAKFIGADAEEIIITTSTTHGINIFAYGIELNRGDTVAFPDCEFPAVVYPWLNQEKLKGIQTVMIPSDKVIIKIEDIEKTIKENNVKVLAISSVEFLGFRNDLNDISKICKDNDCYLLVDAIQSLGVCPMEVKKFGIDYLAGGSQKWMMAPSGVGFAYISSSIRDKVNPTFIGTGSIKYDFKNFLSYKLNFKEDGTAYENSTVNCLGMIGLESSMDLFLKLGVENIFSYILNLIDVFINELKGSDYRIESDLSPEHRSNIILFSHTEKSKNKFIHRELEKKNIFISYREGYLRLSPHIFNNEEDILKLNHELMQVK
jgi:selenocysteine lyase/cysteine desulfurase